MKIDRVAVYKKFDGHCAYCGQAFEFERMQVDHFWPQLLAHLEPNLDNNRFSNLMPSCAKCNNHKHGMRPEIWRRELERQVSMLRKSAQFARALRFGQILTTEHNITFYFETVGATENVESRPQQTTGPAVKR